jgi:acyl carrier protein
MNNEKKLKEAFAEALQIDVTLVNDTLGYRSIAEWDSVSHMVLISILEEKFNVSIDTDDVIALSSVGKAKEILNKQNILF